MTPREPMEAGVESSPSTKKKKQQLGSPDEESPSPNSTPSSSDIKKHSLRRLPWRLKVEPLENILNHEYQGSGTQEDPYVIDFLDVDEDNPQQTFPLTAKWLTLAYAATATLAVALASSAWSGTTTSIAKDFNETSSVKLTLGVSMFVLGFALGPLIWAPLSELYGRRNTVLVSFAFLTFFCGISLVSPNLNTFIALRFLAAAFGCASLVNGGGVVADLFTGNLRGVALVVFSSAPFLGPSLGPLCGGFLGDAYGWKSVEILLAIFSAVVLIVGFFFLAETYMPLILRRRAERLSRLTGKKYLSRIDVGKDISATHQFTVALARPLQLLIFEPIVLLLSIYIGIVYAVLYSFFTAFTYVFGEEARGFNAGQTGLCFLGLAGGVIAAVVYVAVIENPRYIKIADATVGYPEPEVRLSAAKVGAPSIVFGLAVFAGTDSPNIHYMVPVVFSAFFSFGMVLSFLSIASYLIDSYVLYAASVLAANSVIRSLFGMAFPLVTPTMYRAVGIHWGVGIAAALALICAPFPFIFSKYGKKIRAKCRFAAEAAATLETMMKGEKESVKDEAPTTIGANMELGLVRTRSNLSKITSRKQQEEAVPKKQERQRLQQHQEGNEDMDSHQGATDGSSDQLH